MSLYVGDVYARGPRVARARQFGGVWWPIPATALMIGFIPTMIVSFTAGLWIGFATLAFTLMLVLAPTVGLAGWLRVPDSDEFDALLADWRCLPAGLRAETRPAVVEVLDYVRSEDGRRGLVDEDVRRLYSEVRRVADAHRHAEEAARAARRRATRPDREQMLADLTQTRALLAETTRRLHEED